MAKRGLPPRGDFSNRSRVYSSRIREDTLDAIKAKAAESGKSVSQEIEWRLRRSLEDDLRIADRYANRQTYALVRLIVAALEGAPNKPDAPWFDDAANFNLMLDTVVRILGAFRPSDTPAEISETERWMGDMNAARIAEDVSDADAAMPPNQAANSFNYIKADLGSLAGRLKSLEGSGLSPGERPRVARKGK